MTSAWWNAPSALDVPRSSRRRRVGLHARDRCRVPAREARRAPAPRAPRGTPEDADREQVQDFVAGQDRMWVLRLGSRTRSPSRQSCWMPPGPSGGRRRTRAPARAPAGARPARSSRRGCGRAARRRPLSVVEIGRTAQPTHQAAKIVAAASHRPPARALARAPTRAVSGAAARMPRRRASARRHVGGAHVQDRLGGSPRIPRGSATTASKAPPNRYRAGPGPGDGDQPLPGPDCRSATGFARATKGSRHGDYAASDSSPLSAPR